MMAFLRGVRRPAKAGGGNSGNEPPTRRLDGGEPETGGDARPAALLTPERTPEVGSFGPKLLYGYSTERGARRRNEDCCGASGDSLFFAISDGIGGGPHGDVMSRLAVSSAIEAYECGCSPEEAFARADGLTSQVSRHIGEGDGATLLLAAYDRGAARLDILSAGDTLAYRLRDGALSLLSGGEGRARANTLEKAVGWGGTEPDRISSDMHADDRIALLTDGVWEPLEEETLAKLLQESPNALLAARRLCKEATAIGTDNATAICIFFEKSSVQTPQD